MTHIKQKAQKGFTLVELLVVLAVFAMVTGVTMTSYGKFGNRTLLKNLAYSTALVLREAQVSGLAGRNAQISGGSFTKSFGVYFTQNSTEFRSFIDENLNKRFDNVAEEYNPPSGIGALHKLRNGHKITKLKVEENGSWINVSELHITFIRPEPDAVIYAKLINGGIAGPYSSAAIKMVSPAGNILFVVVNATGQIAVQKQL